MHLQICLLAKTVLLIFSQEQIKHMLITTLGWNPSAFQQVCQKCNLTFSTPALYWTQESSLSLSNPIPSSTCDTAENELQVRYQQYSEDSSPVSSHQVSTCSLAQRRQHWLMAKAQTDLCLLKYICAHVLPGPTALFLKPGQKIPQVPSDR